MNEVTLWNFILKTISSNKKAVMLVVAESFWKLIQVN
jgi:hypothetical protein